MRSIRRTEACRAYHSAVQNFMVNLFTDGIYSKK